ncbi:unnamed protein product [Calicophoron daubneyi]|uniref:FAS1 domain-containing protein n=1 Tax=Calicophoron daubneyi TaxID=300641 RepID=A0AAV2TT45_CALDB
MQLHGLSILKLISILILGAFGSYYAPVTLEQSKFYEVARRHAEENICPYLKVGDKLLPVACFTCNFPFSLYFRVRLLSRFSDRYVYDCCSGYERNELIKNKCSLRAPTWKTIVKFLKDNGSVLTADALENNTAIADLNKNPAEKVYSVFVPFQDANIQNGEKNYTGLDNSARNLVALGRHYSNTFTNGKKIRNENSVDIKITTYSNGLTFADCRMLMKVDLETTNGLIHYTDGALPPTNQYPTVLSRLMAEPDLSRFVQALPRDVRSELDKRDSNIWYTVFAPTNSAWDAAVRSLASGESVDTLARNHILPKMICSGAIIRTSFDIGPTLGEGKLGLSQKPTGKVVVLSEGHREIPIVRNDIMSGTGVIHVINEAIAPLKVLPLKEVLQQLQNNPRSGMAQAAKELSQCDILDKTTAKIVLLPNDEAFRRLKADKVYNQKMQDKEFRCKVYAYHLLKSNNPSLKKLKSPGFVQEEAFETEYRTPENKPTYVTGTYVKKRDTTKLNFNGASGDKNNVKEFRNGYIYPVDSFNHPPEKTILELIKEEPDTKITMGKIDSTNYGQDLAPLHPKVLLLVPTNMGWNSRDLENSYNKPQTKKLLQLHTIPHPMFGGEDGFVPYDTVHVVDTLLPDRDSGFVKLTIKRSSDGSTFIGHPELPESAWAMVTKWNKVGTDGVVWIVDWPIRCPEQMCQNGL